MATWPVYPRFLIEGSFSGIADKGIGVLAYKPPSAFKHRKSLAF